jgi:hypothetical protein
VFFARGEQRYVAGFGDDYFLPTVFFLAGFLAAAFFTGAFLAADFFLAGIRFPPFPLATANHHMSGTVREQPSYDYLH